MFARLTAPEPPASVGRASRTLSPRCYRRLITSSASVGLCPAPPPFPSRQGSTTCGAESIGTMFSVHGIGSHFESRSELFMMGETFTLLHTRRRMDLPLGRDISVSCLRRIADTFTILFISSHSQPSMTTHTNKGEQNGCRQRLVWHLSCHRRLPLAVA
jgi:hypothetical protein